MTHWTIGCSSNNSSISPQSPASKLQHTMELKKKKKHKKEECPDQLKQKKQSQKPNSDPSFKPSSEVKGLRFGGQFVVRSFTVRRASSLELLGLLSLPPPTSNDQTRTIPFPSTTTFLPTNFTILAHHAWHTLTLGLGTKKSKVLIFVFDTDTMKSGVDRIWPYVIPLGEVNKKLIRGLTGCEMARFKFRKGCITFYVYAIRQTGVAGFSCAQDLRTILQSVVALKDFLDHTAMLACPSQRSIGFTPATAMAH